MQTHPRFTFSGAAAGLWVAGLLCLTLAAAAQESKPTAGLDLRAAQERPITRADFAGYFIRQQSAVLHLGTSYEIAYKIAISKEDPKKLRPVEGYIGMPRPASSNWYHSGFLFISINGKDIGSTPLSGMYVAERETRAILDLVWHAEAADVRVRFLGLPDQDHFYCEIGLDPKQEIESVGVKLRCYPSYFTSWNKRDGARRIRTPGALVEQGKRVTLPAKDNWWGVYYDEIFDVAKGEGEGPCAMMLLPEEATDISFDPGSYAVGTTISYPAETRRIRLAFWDFKGKTNAEALARLQEGAEAVRKELTELDFTPACVTGFDIAAVRAEVERALKSEVAREALGERIAEIQAWLDEHAGALEGEPGAASIVAEEQLIQSVDKYYSFMWEVKLAELVSELQTQNDE